LRPRQRIALLIIACVAASDCRDAPEPFVPPGPEAPAEPVWQLTFSPGDDRTPTWSADGARVIYSAAGFEDSAATRGLLLSIPFEGGPAETALPDVQTDTGPPFWFTTPSTTASGERLAFAHVIRLFDEFLCLEPLVTDCGQPSDTVFPQPRLETVSIKARRLDETGPFSADPRFDIEFEGRIFDGTVRPDGLPGVWRIDYYPFHQVHVEEATLIFRPSWSPDGTRIAFSDGLRILIWNVDGTAPTPVAGTSDGVSPAWSPDGAHIAFTRLERLGSEMSFCRIFVDSPNGPLLNCAEERTMYTMGRRVITVVRPDGSESTELGEGEEPAWAPDGKTIFYRRGDQLWKRSIEGGDPAPIPGTVGGREPAVSPAGDHIAFARPDAQGTYFIWIARLEP
jgi:WD40 repeat protein